MPASSGVSRRRFLAAGAAGALVATARGGPAPVLAEDGDDGAASAESVARVDTMPSQTMQGIGASGAWWPNDVVRFDPAVQDRIADLLFGPSGIALSVYRYNIGGGGVGVTHAGHDTEAFLIEPGSYDWIRDRGGRRFLRLAADRGVPILIGFVNSAPPAWTTNGESLGGYLKPGAEADFAHYLADVVVHLHDHEGITLSYVSPMNEPDHTFAGGSQEGMGVPVEQRAPLIKALGAELAARAPYCRVIADESSRTGEHFLREARGWLDVDDTQTYVAALAHHRYDFPNDITLELARELGEQIGKPLWSTEVCCFDSRTGAWGQQYDPTIASGLILARLIWQGLTRANDAAFHWWVACSPVMGCDPMADPDAASKVNDEGWNDGLLYYDPNFAENGNQQIYLTKRYSVMGQFSRYVRPGARRHRVRGASRGLCVVAFAQPPSTTSTSPGPRSTVPPSRATATAVVAPAQVPGNPRDTSSGRTAADVIAENWTIVVVNTARSGTGTSTFRLQLPLAQGTWIVPEAAVETSAHRDLESVPLPQASATGLVTIRVPAASITTCVFKVAGEQ
jgi:O-glycosyl hydrolase